MIDGLPAEILALSNIIHHVKNLLQLAYIMPWLLHILHFSPFLLSLFFNHLVIDLKQKQNFLKLWNTVSPVEHQMTAKIIEFMYIVATILWSSGYVRLSGK